MTTRARDFKFAGTPVQRLQLAMVAYTQKSFSAQYAWFSRGGSPITPEGQQTSVQVRIIWLSYVLLISMNHMCSIVCMVAN